MAFSPSSRRETGIGHEIDTSLADLAADFHALTPTAAAQAAVPDRHEFIQRLDNMSEDLATSAENCIRDRRNLLKTAAHRLQIQAPAERICREQKQLSGLEARLKNSGRLLPERPKLQLQGLSQKLEALNPTNIMRRGYAVVYRDESVIGSAFALSAGDRVRIGFYDGEKNACIEADEA